jgi:hypothetical protein
MQSDQGLKNHLALIIETSHFDDGRGAGNDIMEKMTLSARLSVVKAQHPLVNVFSRKSSL